MPVLVRNRKPGPTVFVDDTHNVFVQWGGAGEADGSDVQEVGDNVLKHPSFSRNVRLGVFELIDVDEEKAMQLLAPGVAGATAAQAAADQAVLDSLEASNIENDIMEVKCLISGETLYKSYGDIRSAPPLADHLADQASQFTRVEIPGTFNSKGEPEIAWVRTPQAASQPGQ